MCFSASSYKIFTQLLHRRSAHPTQLVWQVEHAPRLQFLQAMFKLPSMSFQHSMQPCEFGIFLKRSKQLKKSSEIHRTHPHHQLYQLPSSYLHCRLCLQACRFSYWHQRRVRQEFSLKMQTNSQKFKITNRRSLTINFLHDFPVFLIRQTLSDIKLHLQS